MQDRNDAELLGQYVRQQSQEAFGALVARHVNLVHSVALRHVSSLQEAEDITQVVFLLLAKKAGSLSSKTILSGWLYRTAQLTAANHLRMETRRQRREQEACMQSLINKPDPDAWPEIAPALDAAMARLGDRERNAVVLRFFEGKSLKEVGRAIGASEMAAQKCVERAIEKLRVFLTRRGLALSAVALAGALSVNSVQAAPAELAGKVATVAATKAAIVGPVLPLLKSTSHLMTWLKVKTAAKIAAVLLLVAGTATVALTAGDYIKRGRFFLGKGDYAHAIANFDQALQLDPQSAPAHFGRGRASKLNGDLDQALADYTQAIQTNPKAVGAYVNRGQIYHLDGDDDRAIADFDTAIQLDAQRPIPFLDRGVSYGQKGDYARAVADFRSAIRIDPQFSPAYNNLALQLASSPDASLRNGKQAVTYALKACELSHWSNLNQISTLAASYAEAGDFESAIKWESNVQNSPGATAREISVANKRLVLYRAHQPFHRTENSTQETTP